MPPRIVTSPLQSPMPRPVRGIAVVATGALSLRKMPGSVLCLTCINAPDFLAFKLVT